MQCLDSHLGSHHLDLLAVGVVRSWRGVEAFGMFVVVLVEDVVGRAVPLLVVVDFERG